MRRDSAAAVVAAIFFLARGSGEAQVCSPQWSGVDPANGNFTPTTWVDGSFRWTNNAVGARFLGVWANTDFDIWIVGYADFPGHTIAAHFDGYSWHPTRLPPTGRIYGVWGSASNDVWAVGEWLQPGDRSIKHWDGTQWDTVPSGTTEALYAVTGTSSSDVWAAGAGVMLHWDGTSWTHSPGFVPDLYPAFSASEGAGEGAFIGLAAISSSDALVATGVGCQRWDGTSWHPTDCGVEGGRSIFAASSDDIWVIGNAFGWSYRAHWDGSSWNTTVVPYRPPAGWGSIAGTGPADIWIDGTLHYDGNSWTETNCGPSFTAMSVSNNGTLFGVNYFGVQYFAGNDRWPFLARTYVRWQALGGRDPANIWAVDDQGAVARYDSSRWSGQDFPLPDSDLLAWAFGSSPSDIWGITRRTNGLRHFDGRGWSTVDGPGVFAGFAWSPNDAIAVDRVNHPWHWDGTSWQEIDRPIFGDDFISQFWGTAADDVWAIGRGRGGGVIHHWDGDSWQRVYSALGTMTQVGGSGRDDVWFTLDRSEPPRWRTTVLHWDGTSFTELATVGIFTWAMAAANPNDLWLFSYFLYDRMALHYENGNWKAEELDDFGWRALGLRGAGVFFTTLNGHIYQHP